MSAPTVLVIGGTGVISTSCTRYAAEQGMAVSILNRGSSSTHGVPDGVEVLHADVRDVSAVRSAISSREFDVVVDFLAFHPDNVQQDVDVFAGRTGQYVFISSASAYQTPPTHLPVTESTPLSNPFWEYSRNKIACEDLLVAAYRDSAFPVTIVRPSHTYDQTGTPLSGGWTAVERMRQGKPVVVPGDGTSLWTLTHHTDFARAFVGLLDRSAAIGEAVHITSDEALTWDQVTRELARAAGVEADIVHVTSDTLAAEDAELGASWLGDKAHSMVFDNTKVKTLVPGWSARVPFRQGAGEIVEWHDADPSRRQVDEHLDAIYDRLAERAVRAPR